MEREQLVVVVQSFHYFTLLVADFSPRVDILSIMNLILQSSVFMLLLMTPKCIAYRRNTIFRSCSRQTSSTLKLVTDSSLVSLAAGAIAGSIGVGAAYPLDALKTKAQVAAAQRNVATEGNSIGMVGMFRLVIQEEGIGGLYGGVKGVMFGQAFIKALAFSSNNWALTFLEHDNLDNASSLEILIAAAAFSGFVTSFLVNPIERIKILMQADNQGIYKNELDCMRQIIQQDGMRGLLGRGLDATLAREVPGYGLYFVAYSLLIQSEVGRILGQTLAPLICGAAAGCISWIPVSILLCF